MRVLVAALALTMAGSFKGSPLSAQRRELTVIAGANYSGASGGSVAKLDARPGFLAGLSIRLPRTSQLSFQTELLLVLHRLYGERAPSTLPPVQAGPRADAASLLYLKVPVLARLQRGYSSVRPVRPFLVFGPYLGIRLSCKRDLTEAGGNTRPVGCDVPNGTLSGPDAYFPALYQEVDVGLLGELGVEVRRMSLRFRGEKSFRNLVDPGAVPTSPFDNSRLWSGSLAIEYLIRVL